MEFSRQLKKRELEVYIKICTRIWGVVPIDVDWAIGTKPYKEQFASEFYMVTIRMQDAHTQTRVYISREEFNRDKKMAEENKKYKSKYDMYNCMVQGCPLLQGNQNITIGNSFIYQIPYNGGADCKVEILNIEK